MLTLRSIEPPQPLCENAGGLVGLRVEVNRRRHGVVNLYRALMAPCAAVEYFALLRCHRRVLNANNFNLSVVRFHGRSLKIQTIDADGFR